TAIAQTATAATAAGKAAAATGKTCTGLAAVPVKAATAATGTGGAGAAHGAVVDQVHVIQHHIGARVDEHCAARPHATATAIGTITTGGHTLSQSQVIQVHQ